MSRIQTGGGGVIKFEDSNMSKKSVKKGNKSL